MPLSTKTSKLIRLAILASPLAVAACGEGFEAVRVEGVVPYTHERTAGTGVAYVRAKMLPQKELKLESSAPVVTAPPPSTPAPPPAPMPPPAQAEKVFHDKQAK